MPDVEPIPEDFGEFDDLSEVLGTGAPRRRRRRLGPKPALPAPVNEDLINPVMADALTRMIDLAVSAASDDPPPGVSEEEIYSDAPPLPRYGPVVDLQGREVDYNGEPFEQPEKEKVTTPLRPVNVVKRRPMSEDEKIDEDRQHEAKMRQIADEIANELWTFTHESMPNWRSWDCIARTEERLLKKYAEQYGRSADGALKSGLKPIKVRRDEIPEEHRGKAPQPFE